MTTSKIYQKMRKNARGQYLLLSFCAFLSVLLITAFALMYFGPTVQNFLPEGGDTRKMASLLLAATALGCFIFTLYASSMFFRYKSREYGILMALGLEKKNLRRLLFKELSVITAAASLAGLLCAVPVSYLIWKLFELFIISNEQMTYRFGAAGFLPGILFAACLALMLGLAARRFINKSDIMDILRTQHKTQMVKTVKGWILPVGIVLMFLGVALGSGLPQVAARVFKVNLPSAVNLFYLLTVIGIYLVLLSIVAQSRAGKNKEKYYKNLVSISLMRFTAKASTRNMCVIVLLIFVCCFASFYGMQYSLTPDLAKSDDFAFSLHYPALEKQIDQEDVYRTAQKYDLKVEDFIQGQASNLVISYTATDISEDENRYVEKYYDQQKGALFLSASSYAAISGKKITVQEGTYKTVTSKDYKGFFDQVDGLDRVTNPDSGKSMKLAYGGSLEQNSLYAMSDPFAYVISDDDYRRMTRGLDQDYQEHLIFFDVDDVERSYDFAKALLSQYVDRATARSNHMGYWDAWEEQQTQKAGKEYGYSDRIDMSMDNNLLLNDWKYAPGFQIIQLQDQMQLISVYVMLCLYICIIALAAVSVMTYVRSISVASDNKELFDSLEKLGADRAYRQKVLKRQLAKIFQYPTAIGCSLGFLFSLAMDISNDGRLAGTEFTALGILLGIIAAISAILFAVYRYALKRAQILIGI
ncbi:FtsX-like permease family protein [Emergencia timonensis]|uniref:FtsX-like permease family protein n=1 Tax=Emergencia timonensis TaxID=1776384 RepID=UPI0039930EAD